MTGDGFKTCVSGPLFGRLRVGLRRAKAARTGFETGCNHNARSDACGVQSVYCRCVVAISV